MSLKLGDIAKISYNIKNASRKAAKVLQVICFGEESGKLNRRKLRDFVGFDLCEEDLSAKIKTVAGMFSLVDLVSVCSILCLEYDGEVMDLSKQICEYLNDINKLNLSIDSSEEDQSSCDELSKSESCSQVGSDFVPRISSQTSFVAPQQRVISEPSKYRSSCQFFLTFKDIEDTVSYYDASGVQTIEDWINEFEQNATLYEWSSLQKLVFAKKLLRGLAKTFICSEKNLTSWENLRKSLLTEFKYRVNSAELHKILANRKKRKEENVFEYLMSMKELAARGSIDEESLIHYVIEGIPDNPHNKSVLYGCTSLGQLKAQLRIYEVITLRAQQSTPTVYQPSRNLCFNCHESGHRAVDCQKAKRERGSCYQCGSLDHQKPSCPERRKDSVKGKFDEDKNLGRWNPVENTLNFIQVVPCYTTEVSIDFLSCPVMAMLDTGSPISLICSDVLPNHVSLTPHTSPVSFEGVNRGKLNILGKIKRIISTQGCKVEVEFFVVPRNSMAGLCLLGRDFISNPDIHIEFKKEVKISETKLTNENTSFSLEPNLKINNSISEKIKTNVDVMLENCRNAEKSEVSDLKICDIGENLEKAGRDSEMSGLVNKARYRARYDKSLKAPNQYGIGDYVMLKKVDTTPVVNKKFRDPCVVKRVLGDDRCCVGDVDGFQVSGMPPYRAGCSPQNVERWYTAARPVT